MQDVAYTALECLLRPTDASGCVRPFAKALSELAMQQVAHRSPQPLEARASCCRCTNARYRQLPNPSASLPFIMKLSPLRTCRVSSERDHAASAHVFSPRDRWRWSRWDRLRCRAARACARSRAQACQLTHALATSRRAQKLSARAIAASSRRCVRSAASASCHVAKQLASPRDTTKRSPARSNLPVCER